MGWMRDVLEYAVDSRRLLSSRFSDNIPTRVAVAVKAWEVATRNIQPDAVTGLKHIFTTLRIV